MTIVLDKATDRAWKHVEALFIINSEADYKRARKDLDELVDEVGSDENHPIPAAAPRKVLAFLMEQHGLKQQDLKEVGTQGIVSEVLSGKRELNVRQIRKLAARFGVSPAVFVG